MSQNLVSFCSQEELASLPLSCVFEPIFLVGFNELVLDSTYEVFADESRRLCGQGLLILASMTVIFVRFLGLGGMA
jgi:hypothetical protein